MGAYLHIESTGSSPQAKLERGQSPVPSAIVVAASTTPPFPVFDRLLELLFFWVPRSSISPQAPLPHPSPPHILLPLLFNLLLHRLLQLFRPLFASLLLDPN